jgi:hypothetical protein
VKESERAISGQVNTSEKRRMKGKREREKEIERKKIEREREREAMQIACKREYSYNAREELYASCMCVHTLVFKGTRAYTR